MSLAYRIGLYSGRLVLVFIYCAMLVSIFAALYLKFEPIAEFRYLHF